MLLTLMYHRINDPKNGFKPEAFYQHLKNLKDNYPILIPGEKVDKDSISLCLTFDDAFFDFYHDAFPMLKELDIRAILAVPSDYIEDESDISTKKRLSLSGFEGFDRKYQKTHSPFCTWTELKQMVDSRQVLIASHSHTHPHLTKFGLDLSEEILLSKTILSEKLDTPVHSFIYPYGDMNRRVHKLVRENYLYAFRIGSASNRDWSQGNGLLYRIDAEHFWPDNSFPNPKQLNKFKRKFWLNQLRGV